MGAQNDKRVENNHINFCIIMIFHISQNVQNCPKPGQFPFWPLGAKNTFFGLTASSQSRDRFFTFFLLNLGGILTNIGKVALFRQYRIGGSAVLDIFKMSKTQLTPIQNSCKNAPLRHLFFNIGMSSRKIFLILCRRLFFCKSKTA